MQPGMGTSSEGLYMNIHLGRTIACWLRVKGFCPWRHSSRAATAQFPEPFSRWQRMGHHCRSGMVSIAAAILVLGTVAHGWAESPDEASAALVKTAPGDYKAWALHCQNLIDRGDKETGETQACTYEMALLCARKSQDIFNSTKNDPAVAADALAALAAVLNSPKGSRGKNLTATWEMRGDDICLGALGMALAKNGLLVEGSQAIMLALQKLDEKGSASLDTMKRRSDLKAFFQRIGMPTVGWRAAALGSTKVAKIVNILNTKVAFVVQHVRDNAVQKSETFLIEPRALLELGHMEGYKFKSGDALSVLQVGADKKIIRQVSFPVP